MANILACKDRHACGCFTRSLLDARSRDDEGLQARRLLRFIGRDVPGDQKEREEEYLSNGKKSFSYCFL